MLNFTKITEQSQVKELFNYNPNTGIFTLRKKPHNTYSKRIGDKIGTKDGRGYLVFQFKRKRYFLHRLAFLYMEGYYPKIIDHINQKKDDNSWENLREVTCQENNRNKKRNSKSKTGFHGITEEKNGKYRAVIYVKYTRISLGTFEKLEEAIKARKHAEKIYGFHKNHGS